MEIIYFTITGTNHYFGHEFCETGMRVRLVKEPDNEFDKEAIRVEMPGLGKVGYVANSSYTVKGESWSAGRIYDRIGKRAFGRVKLILPDGVIYEKDGAEHKLTGFDTIVLALGVRAYNPLEEAVKAMGKQAIVIGDASQPGPANKATEAALEAVMNIK